jgi:hypothetical protein
MDNPDEPTTEITLDLDVEIIDWLHKEAAARQQTVDQVFNQTLREALAKLEQDALLKKPDADL